MTTAAGWYPDPGATGHLRWWDGSQWTEHLQAGQQPAPQHQAPAGPLRSPLSEPILVVAQKRKIIELTNEYDVAGADGGVVGYVAEIGQSNVKKAARFLSSLDQFLTHTLEVRDSWQRPIMVLTRPAKVVKSSVIVAAPDGRELGRIIQRNVFGKIRFGMESGGYEVGSINAENWRAWNFSVTDHAGVEVARITKTWEGLATTLFTTADHYVVHIHHQLPEPLRSMVVASALTVDTALKQDDRGFN